MSSTLNIDKLTIQLAAGWQGDPVFLARKISEQIQLQANQLHTEKQISISLQGQFNNNPKQLVEQFNRQLLNHNRLATRGKISD